MAIESLEKADIPGREGRSKKRIFPKKGVGWRSDSKKADIPGREGRSEKLIFPKKGVGWRSDFKRL